MLPRVQAVLETLKNCTDEQKEALVYHFQCLLSLLAVCVSAKIIQGVPTTYHDEYLRQIGEKIIKDTTWYFYAVYPLGYTDEKELNEIIQALKEEVTITTKNAKCEPLTFSDWHTVV